MTAYLGLGSNSGDRAASIGAALEGLGKILSGMRKSPLFLSRPMYLEDQPDFLNCAVAGETELSPEGLLDAIQAIERKLGRDRTKERRMGKRPIDIDILLFGQTAMEEENLVIPHPRLLERKFALLPLLCLEPALTDPSGKRPLSRVYSELPEQGIYYSSLQSYSCLRHDE